VSTNEIDQERENQKANWSTESDDAMALPEWAALIAHYATRRMVGNLKAVDVPTFRADMVKVGALAKACIESIDRKGADGV
jgi:hypothetical protein